jgi:hypothetical protein
MKNDILYPVVLLMAWTMVMWGWMYATRLPTIFKMKMKLDPYAPRGEQMNSLPPEVRWKADNYNHLFEAPTLFYGICIILAFIGEGKGLNVTLAWIYLSLRIIHSFVQATYNKIEHRFAIFILSSIVLIGLIMNTIRLLN